MAEKVPGTPDKKTCPFLENNKCTHYANRPKDCSSYPHLQKEDFVFRLIGVIENYAICPIVFNVYEQLKEKVGYQGFEFDDFDDFEDDWDDDFDGMEDSDEDDEY